MIIKTWQGYEVRHDRRKWYIKSVRNGMVKWTFDYAHAGHYSEKTARMHDENIRGGVYTW